LAILIRAKQALTVDCFIALWICLYCLIASKKKKNEQVSIEVMNYCGNFKKMYNSCAGLGNHTEKNAQL
jgi:hypothetical protein